MTVETLVEYIKEGKKKGFTLEQLHKSLLDQGYNIEEIQSAVLIEENAPTLTEEHGIKMNNQKIKKHNPLVFIIGIVLILILFVALLVLNLGNIKSSKKTTEDNLEIDEIPIAPDTNPNMESSTTETDSYETEPEEIPSAPDSQEFNEDNNQLEENEIEEIPELPEE